ncbi:MAG TPA: hypothetical protein VIK97_15625 [Casimicrobiaceae bacterium]
MMPNFERLQDAVRTNCHISDAQHARDLTLCTYLLEMRELYRWERGIALGAPLPQAEVGLWMAQREVLWSSLEQETHVPVPVDGWVVDPFDVERANQVLIGHRLVYGAGIGRFGKPQFFLGALEREESRNGVRVLIAGREYARDLSAAPAASRNGTIYVRLESLQRWLWERAEAWMGKRGDGALKSALDSYGFTDAPDAAIASMAQAEAETLILHELGECEAGGSLGPQWESMLGSLSRRRNELFVRALRDHLADCLVTLPSLLEHDAAASLHFWFANLHGMRQVLFPRLTAAYARWREGDDGAALRAAIDAGALHWRRVCMQVLVLHAAGDDEDAIEALSSTRTTAL